MPFLQLLIVAFRLPGKHSKAVKCFPAISRNARQSFCDVRKARPLCKAEHSNRKQEEGEVGENVKLSDFVANQARNTHRKTISH